MGEPVLEFGNLSNIHGEHIFCVRITFGASTASTYRAKDCVVARTSGTVFTVTLPKAYTEVTSLSEAWFKPTGAAALRAQITTNAVDSTGVLTFTTTANNTAGTATAPASGDVLYLTIGVSCDKLNDLYTGTTA